MLNSPIDIAVICGIALLVFGPKKLPEFGKALGQGIGNFKKSLQDVQDEVKGAISTESSSSKNVQSNTSESGTTPKA